MEGKNDMDFRKRGGSGGKEVRQNTLEEATRGIRVRITCSAEFREEVQHIEDSVYYVEEFVTCGDGETWAVLVDCGHEMKTFIKLKHIDLIEEEQQDANERI